MLAAVEADLPRPSVDVDALVPYSRGDLINKVHEHGEIVSIEHRPDGSRLKARVNPGLAGELAQFALVAVTATVGTSS